MQGPAEFAREIFLSGLKRITGEAIMRSSIRRDGDVLILPHGSIDMAPYERVWVCGSGKAALSMARGLAQVIGPKFRPGLLVTTQSESTHVDPDDLAPADPLLPHAKTRFTIMAAGHPMPDQASLEAGEAMISFASRRDEGDLVLYVLSGGTSALLESPVEGITLEDLRRTNEVLLDSGWAINDINNVRKRISRIKNGGLARCFSWSTVICIVLSDVIGDDLATIGSGPLYEAVLPPLWTLPAKLPTRVLAQFGRRIDPPPINNPPHVILANARTAGEKFASVGREHGLKVQIADQPFLTEARDLGRTWAQRLQQMEPGSAWIGYGESVVTVDGPAGKGGRAQEAALAAAIELEGQDPNLAVLVAGTDGIDGPTDAAGAAVDRDSVLRSGMNAAGELKRHNAYEFHEAAATLIRTGPTGTNLNEVAILLRR